jgi:HSP90 family molecular chaperone
LRSDMSRDDKINALKQEVSKKLLDSLKTSLAHAKGNSSKVIEKFADILKQNVTDCPSQRALVAAVKC